MFRVNTGGLGLAKEKETDIAVIWFSGMNADGEFDCPKCKVKISPEMANEWEELETNSEFMLIRHLCGQKIKIMLGGNSV